jgi:hypothetical protein
MWMLLAFSMVAIASIVAFPIYGWPEAAPRAEELPAQNRA